MMMRYLLLTIFTLHLSTVLHSTALAQPLPRATPESQGVASAQIQKFIEAADQSINTLHSFMLIRHGKVVAECWWQPQTPTTPHVMHSLSKSFTSTAVGFAVSEGKLSVDDQVIKFFPDHLPAEISPNLKAMRVKDLLTMSTGHETEPKLIGGPGDSGIRMFLAHPVPHKPGTHFKYNTPATYMLSAIVQKVSGEKLIDYLTPRLFKPLGIENPAWSTSAEGINYGGFGLMITTEDIARFGLFTLNEGQWNGQQLLPAAWIREATSKHVSNGSNPQSDWEQGYGYQFWRCRHGAFRGDGKDGQFCIVLPEQDAVIAITAHTSNMQAELNVVWDHLLAAFHEAPLAEDPASQTRLKEVSSKLVAGQPKGTSKLLLSQKIPSEILKKEMKYSIYLPAGYEGSTTSYPVLYLLHGFGDDETSWQLKGNMQPLADAAIATRRALPMIIVMPDAEKRYYMNSVMGEYMYEDYFIKELMPHIEKTYRTRTDRADRALSGLSMGGYGSLLYALHHPELFASCYAMSAGVRSDEEMRAIPFAEFKKRYVPSVGDLEEGDERITEFYNRNSVLYLLPKTPVEQLKQTRWFIDCGDDDFLYKGNSLLHITFSDMKVPHEYRVRDGGHNWKYWQRSLPDALEFVSESFSKEK
ncbi:Endo-1,4-beta-xylanase/feruloyl esterase precursor [Planctopirus ephydatiae]|uniref:Endo-1,4-beta-xylanase/feruloyl esterase n=1 Tax=Planctopirus ephydatiae TaxID=2528019 RepID=A0A518GSI2_9PLAN|nr:serine hydrolase [Planctopirus ephydatiae]QDV31548.1 Endo-1,4-beta-xylanase/feruloyl esterase precursor [Planctopirus ephydatiae]